MKKLELLPTLLITLFFSSCGDTNKEQTKAYFGDKKNNRVVVVNVEEMKLNNPIDELYTGHQLTYTADKVFNQSKIYVVNRGSNAIDVLNLNPLELTKSIPLLHFPRSAESMNTTLNINETSGMDKPMASIIDLNKDRVIATVGQNTKVDKEKNPNFGGSHATGHPFWLDAHHFVLIDRYHRKIETYYIEKDSHQEWKTEKLNELHTTTSLHQIIPSKGFYQGEKNTFYATAEGAPNIYPSIIEFKLEPHVGLKQTRELILKKEGVDVNSMSLHHGDFHPTKKLIYVGSADGTLFMVNYQTMSIVKTIPAGKGAGHTVMIPQKDLAVVVNHKDTFITIIDTLTNTKVKDISVSLREDLVGKGMIQAHPKYHVSKNNHFFHAFLTAEGIMYELNLDRLEVSRKVEVGGEPSQGCFVSF